MMKLFIALLLSITLAGCASGSRSARYSTPASYSSVPMIIHDEDIEKTNIAIARKTSPVSAYGNISHKVKAGETLWAISKLYDVDLDDLVKANMISDAASIETGQVLKIPARTASRPVSRKNYTTSRNTTFIWPVNGTVEARFGSKVDKAVNKGLDIKASLGANVVASRGGKIVYCDEYLKGFGKTVIIDHMDGFQTVYSYNSDILVKAGDLVQQRDIIARVGSSGRANKPMLHFEIRKNGEPQNPEFYLTRAR